MSSPAAPARTRPGAGRRTARARSRSTPVALDEAPARGTRVVLHVAEDAKSYTERWNLERIVKAQSGHVPVPIVFVEKPGAEPAEISDGGALWTKPRSEITPAEYTDFYRSIAGQFDEPALTVHYRAEGRHEFTALMFVPGSRPFDLFDADRKGRIKLYVKRVFITDDAEILPRYLRFVRGLVDSADLPLNVSREMIQYEPDPGGDQEERDRPRARRPRKARRQRCRRLRQGLGELRLRAEGGPLRGLRAARCAARVGALQQHGVRRRAAQPEGLCRRAEGEPDRDLLSRRQRSRAAQGLAASGRLPRPRRRGAAAGRSGRQLLGDVGAVVRRQAVQVGDPGRGRSGADPAHRRQGRGQRRKPRPPRPISSPSSSRRSATRSRTCAPPTG